MALPKLFNLITWHNNTTPAINEDNLNAMSQAIDDIDDRVIGLAGTIMEDVPQIQEDIEELEEDFALIDEKIADATSEANRATTEANRATTKANEAAASVISAGNKALISEGYAKGTQNGTPVGSSSPYYHNNAEYFKEQARSFTPTGYQDLVDDVAEAQEAITDIEGEKVSSNDAYVLRQCKGNSVDLRLVGGSIAWNQQLSGLSSDDSANGNLVANRCTDSYDSTTKVHTLTALENTGTSGFFFNKPNKHAPLVTGHKYLQSAKVKSPKVFNFKMGTNDAVQTFSSIPANVYNTVSGVFLFGSSSSEFLFNFNVNNSWSGSESVYVTELMLIDLTQMFGSTIADYIYSLEQATAGAGVAWFRQYFRNLYYGYDAGSIQSVNPSFRRARGFNILDVKDVVMGTISNNTGNYVYVTDGNNWCSNSFIPVHSGGKYYVKLPDGFTTSTANTGIYYYDKNKAYIGRDDNVNSFGSVFTVPDNCCYIKYKFYTTISQTSMPKTACINYYTESGSPKNGDYVPYEGYMEYPFDTSVQLRGIFKLDANHKLYADGDIYTADGTVTRKYGIVDLGTLTWTKTSTTDNHYRFSSSGISSVVKKPDNSVTKPNIICGKYITVTPDDTWEYTKVGISIHHTSGDVIVDDLSYTDAATFKTALSGVYLVYELATPTTESAAPFQNPQRAFTDGTEEFVDYGVQSATRDVSIPVGNESKYNTSVVLPISQDYTDGAMEILKEIVASSSDFADFKTKVAAL